MSNPNFAPLFSTNEIYRDTDNTICLTDDLDAIEAAIEELEESQVNPSQFAAADHNHNDDYISKALQFTADNGDVEYLFAADSGKNLLNEIVA